MNDLRRTIWLVLFVQASFLLTPLAARNSMNYRGNGIPLERPGQESAFESMLENMYHGGRIALLGIQPGITRIDCNNIVFKRLTIKGICGREIFETWYEMQTMLTSGLDIAPVITHRFSFDEHQKGCDVTRSGKSGKVILEFD